MITRPDKPAIAERLKIARKAARLSQEALGQRVGMKQQAIAEIERGRVNRPMRLREIALELGRSEAWLLGETAVDDQSADAETASRNFEDIAPNASPAVDAQPMAAWRKVPLLGQAEGGADGRFVLNGQRLAEVFCPAPLENVRDAYAVYVYGDSMVERYNPGEMVWADPHRPVIKGDGVVVQLKPKRRGDFPFGFIKKFVSLSPQRLVLEQLNPPDGEERFLEFPGNQVISVHKIVFVASA